jgi:Family of unknown function (DUF6665)
MTHPPRSQPCREPLAGLEYDLVREQAATLGRVGRKLEAALAALTAFDSESAGEPNAAGDKRARRAALVNTAGTALWHFIIQREACGLRDSRQVMRDYRVPGEVIARMGISC